VLNNTSLYQIAKRHRKAREDMYIFFCSPDDLSRAMRIGEKMHVFESQHYTVDAEKNRITFDSAYPEKVHMFIAAIKHANSCPDKQPICFNIAR